MENIRPSSDLRNKYNEMSNLCKKTREPIYITVNGRGDTVLIGLTEYRQQQAELELLRMLAEAEEDVQNNRVLRIEETFNDIEAKLKARDK